MTAKALQEIEKGTIEKI